MVARNKFRLRGPVPDARRGIFCMHNTCKPCKHKVLSGASFYCTRPRREHEYAFLLCNFLSASADAGGRSGGESETLFSAPLGC